MPIPVTRVQSVVLVILVVSVSVLYYLHFAQSKEYVFVDAQKLVNGYKGMQVAREQYENKAKILQANLDTLRAEAEAKIKEYEQSAPRMSVKERQLMEELIRTKQFQYTEYEKSVVENIRKEDTELSAKVLERVNSFIKEYGKNNGYTIILAATQYGNIAYAEEKVDITDELLAELNASYK